MGYLLAPTNHFRLRTQLSAHLLEQRNKTHTDPQTQNGHRESSKQEGPLPASDVDIHDDRISFSRDNSTFEQVKTLNLLHIR